MPLTYSNIGKPDVIGRRKITFSDVTFDNSYATGGESIGGGTLNVAANKIIGVSVLGGNAASAAYRITYDTANKKLLAYSGASQVANTTDLSGVVVRVAVYST